MDQKVSILLAAENRFSKPIEAASSSAGKLTRAVTDTEKAMKELGSKSQLISRFKSVSSQLDDTKAKLAGARAELKLLSSGERAAGQSAAEHAAEVRKAKRSVERLTSTLGRQSRELASLRGDLTNAGLRVNALGAEELRLAKQTKQANAALEHQAAKLQRIQSIQARMDDRKDQMGDLAGQALGTAAQMLPFVAAGKRAVEFEGTFADVKKVVNFKDEQEEAAYRTQMMQLAGKLGMSQDGIAQIVTAAGQSGIEKTQLLQFAESATKMSVAWDVSAEEAGSTLATWRAAMGLSQKQALDLADATNYLSNNMNAKAKDIAAVMVREGSTAMQSGLNYNQTAALAASLIAGGATEETGATALKNITGRLTMGYAASGSQKEAMSRIGFDSEELASLMQEDAQGTLIDVFRELQNVSADERGAVISQLFGEEAKGAVSKLVTTLDNPQNGLIAAFGRVAKEAERAGSVEQEYANRANTRGHKLAQLSASFDRMMITLGDRMLPVIDLLVPPLITVVDGVTAFAEANPKLASSLLAVGAGLVVLKAGAIAFKMARLVMGNGMDRLRLGREALSGTTDKTARSATRATSALARLNQQLAGMGSGGFSLRGRKGRRGGAGGVATSVSMAADAAPSRRGKAGRLAALLGGGTALSLMSANANAGELAMAGATVAGTAGDLASALPGGMAVPGGAGKLFRPLDIALSGAALTSAISNGDNKAIGGTAGDMIGGLGGAAAGAMAGAAIGSVVPVIGTAIGGVIGSVVGGFGGGELGGWIGEHIGGWFSTDKTDSPAPIEVAKQAEQLREVNKQITFSPSIQITPSGDPAYDDRVANELIARMHAELSPVLMGQSDVESRSDASLYDRRDS